jgi:hypothetical protein
MHDASRVRLCVNTLAFKEFIEHSNRVFRLVVGRLDWRNAVFNVCFEFLSRGIDRSPKPELSYTLSAIEQLRLMIELSRGARHESASLSVLHGHGWGFVQSQQFRRVAQNEVARDLLGNRARLKPIAYGT